MFLLSPYFPCNVITPLTHVVTMSQLLRGPSPVCRGCWTSSSRAWGPPPWCLSPSAQCPGCGQWWGSSSGGDGDLTSPGRTWRSISCCHDTPPNSGQCGSCRCGNTECWLCWCCDKLDLDLSQEFGICYSSSCNSCFSDTSLWTENKDLPQSPTPWGSDSSRKPSLCHKLEDFEDDDSGGFCLCWSILTQRSRLLSQIQTPASHIHDWSGFRDMDHQDQMTSSAWVVEC